MCVRGPKELAVAQEDVSGSDVISTTKVKARALRARRNHVGGPPANDMRRRAKLGGQVAEGNGEAAHKRPRLGELPATKGQRA